MKTGNHYLGRVIRLNRALARGRVSGSTFDAVMARIQSDMEANGYSF